MRRVFALLCAMMVLTCCVTPALAAQGNVTYTGKSGSIVFAPGSDHSPTDLFPDLKDVMPGDTLTQQITVKNKASNKVKVRVYMRALGAHPDSEAFLSQLRLRVEKSTKNDMAYMMVFDDAASQTGQLTDWVLLGTLYSGGTVNLDVLLDVPTTLGNDAQEQIGYLDWEFKIEERPLEPGDPQPPKTGDQTVWIWVALMGVSLGGILLLLALRKRKKEDK